MDRYVTDIQTNQNYRRVSHGNSSTSYLLIFKSLQGGTGRLQQQPGRVQEAAPHPLLVLGQDHTAGKEVHRGLDR